MGLKALGNTIIVKRDEIKKYQGSIELPDIVKAQFEKVAGSGIVVSIGKDVKQEIFIGDLVYFEQFGGAWADEEKKLLVESYVNEKNGKLISGKTLRRLHSGRLSDLAGIFKMSDKEVETMFKKKADKRITAQGYVELYREKFGFCKSIALCSRGVSEKIRKNN